MVQIHRLRLALAWVHQFLKPVWFFPAVCRFFCLFSCISCTIRAVVAQSPSTSHILKVSTNITSPLPHDTLEAGRDVAIIFTAPDGKIADVFEISLTSETSSAKAVDVRLAERNASVAVDRHYIWTVPSCLSPGQYHVVLSENVNRSEAPAVIASIPVNIRNQTPALACSSGRYGLVTWQPQLGVQHRPSFLRHRRTTSSNSSVSLPPWSMQGDITITAGPSGITTPVTLTPPGLNATIVLQPSRSMYTSSYGSNSTGYRSAAAESSTNSTSASQTGSSGSWSATVVMMSVETVVSTTTAPGTTIEITETRTVVSTTTAAMGFITSTPVGFSPVDAAIYNLALSRGLFVAAILSITMVALLDFFMDI